MRDITNLSAYLAQETGLDMLLVVEIVVGTTSTYYATRTSSLDTLIPKLKSVGNITLQESTRAFIQVQSTNIEIWDNYGALREIMETTGLEKQGCNIYQIREGMSIENGILLLSGEIEGPIVWHEGERYISFSVVTRVSNDNLPGKITQDMFDSWNLGNGDPSVVGSFLPIIYGSVVNSKPLKVTKRPVATLSSRLVINNPKVEDPTIEDSTDLYLIASNDADSIFNGYNLSAIDFLVIDGHVVQVAYHSVTDGVYRFIITNNNPVAYTSTVQLADRDEDDEDHDNPSVIWIEDRSYSMKNKVWLSYEHENANLCVKQLGRKCWFVAPWASRYTVDYTGTGVSVPDEETKWEPRLMEGTEYLNEPRNFKRADMYTLYGDFHDSDIIDVAAGSEVEIWIEDYGYMDDVYIVGQRSPTVTDIKGKTSIKQVLYGVSSDHYSITSNWNGTGCTAIVINPPLPYLDLEGWSEDLYVSARSATGFSIVDGTTNSPSTAWGNTAYILADMINWYTDYAYDEESFNAVRDSITNYPAGFVITDEKKIEEMLGQIAWQSRCILTLSGDTFYLRYLSALPETPVMTIDEDKIIMQSMEPTHAETMNLTTSVTYSWTPSYDKSPRTDVITQGTDLIMNDANWEMFIYNCQSCARISTLFWLNRYSRLWKEWSLICPLEAMQLECYDPLTIDLSGILAEYTSITESSILGELVSSAYDHEASNFKIKIRLANDVGNTDQQDDFWVLSEELSTRPPNPCAYIKLGYYELTIEETETDHTVLSPTHKDTKSRLRVNRHGLVQSVVTGDVASENGDVLAYNSDQAAWMPTASVNGMIARVIITTVHDETNPITYECAEISPGGGLSGTTFTGVLGTSDDTQQFDVGDKAIMIAASGMNRTLLGGGGGGNGAIESYLLNVYNTDVGGT